MAYTCALYDVLQKQIDQYIVSYYTGILNLDLISAKNNLPYAFNYFVIYLCTCIIILLYITCIILLFSNMNVVQFSAVY